VSKKPKSVRSSGNVFEDLGFEKAEAKALLLRADLMFLVAAELRRRNQRQKELGELLGIGQSRVSDLMQGKAKLFSLEMLITFVQRLGMPVTIGVRSRRDQPQARTAVVPQTATASGGAYYYWRAQVYASDTKLESHGQDLQSSSAEADTPIESYVWIGSSTQSSGIGVPTAV
jgi:predicted XRE-type DNA-binding protein